MMMQDALPIWEKEHKKKTSENLWWDLKESTKLLRSTEDLEDHEVVAKKDLHYFGVVRTWFRVRRGICIGRRQEYDYMFEWQVKERLRLNARFPKRVADPTSIPKSRIPMTYSAVKQRAFEK
jgi:hypothetical protein